MSLSAFEMLIRTTVSFITLYILCRILNKKLIAQMTFFDFVAGITIGSIVASSMLMKDVPIVIGMIGLFMFCLYSFITNVIGIKSLIGRKILEGEPTCVMKDGKILEDALKKNRLSVEDLLTQLRKKGVFYVDQVESAFLETDGTISILKWPAYLPAMQKDVLNIQISRGVAQAFIVDGKLLNESLKLLGKDINWVKEILKINNISKIEEVFFAQIDQQNNIYIDKYTD